MGQRAWTVMGVAVLSAAVILGGCTGSSDEPEPEPIPTFVPPPLDALTALGPGEGALSMLVRPGYAEPEWVAPFEQATGCVVTATAFDSDQSLATSVDAGGWDLVSAPGAVALGLIGSGTVAPLNLDLVPAYAQVVADLKNRRWNTWNGITYGVPQGRSAEVLVWRIDRVTTPPADLADLFDAEASSARNTGVRDSSTVLGAAAIVDEVEDPFALDDEQLSSATDVISTAEPALLWQTEQQVYDALASGEIDVALAPAPVADRLVAAGVPVASAVPRGGTLGVSDSWMLRPEALHPNCAYRWLDYTLRGAVQAQSAARTGIAPASTEACVIAPDLCTNTGAQDTAFWSSVTIEVTPLGDCLDGRDDIPCTDAEEWAAAWQRVSGEPDSPSP